MGNKSGKCQISLFLLQKTILLWKTIAMSNFASKVKRCDEAGVHGALIGVCVRYVYARADSLCKRVRK